MVEPHCSNFRIIYNNFLDVRICWIFALCLFFRDLFQQPTSKQCSEITLRNHLEEEAVCQLINFCYSSDITVDSKSADKILTAANFLQVKEVEKLCITFLVAQQALKPEVRGSFTQMSRFMTKPAKWHLHPAKTQISLGICPV